MNKLSPLTLSIKDWTLRAKNHLEMVEPLADAFLKRRSLGLTHPVHDFIFTYYNFSPSKLKQWIPSFEIALEISPYLLEEYPWLDKYWFKEERNQLSLDCAKIPTNTLGVAHFISDLCKNILEKTPRFGCYGLHEWAMVYKLKAEDIRHQGHKLRLSSSQLTSFVDSQSICCSHYDAYRFFTSDARPLNTLNPTIETRIKNEQGGCVHANMDLYKWATKLWPWIGSDFIAKAFLHALECRELDMRASPYDLSNEGYLPICIETEEGRNQYQKEQQYLTIKANALREELRLFCLQFIALKASTPPLI